jgi:diguanylate cyclase (GGDEF)-like protein
MDGVPEQTKDARASMHLQRKVSEQNSAGPLEQPAARSWSWKEMLSFGPDQTQHVLVLDRDREESSLIVEAARKCGARVTALDNTAQAVASMRECAYDVVFADLGAPGIDNCELLAIARDISPETEIFVVASTGNVDLAVECIKRGAEGFILRPGLAKQVAVAMSKARDRKCLKRLAHVDGLTSLFNRRTFEHFLAQECHRCERCRRSFGLLILDVDGFKTYNDLNGHLIGDIALIKLGRLLKESTRASDIAARFGGDEFAVLLTEISVPEALVRANLIRQRVSTTQFQYENNLPQRKLTVSIGLAVFPVHGDNALAIIKHADNALYQAKAQGRNRVCAYNGGAFINSDNHHEQRHRTNT